MQRVHWADPDLTNTRGLGFQIWRSGEKTFVGHGGSCPGYQTHLLLHPETKIATVFMSNAQGVNSQQFAQRLYDIVGPIVVAAAKAKGPAPAAPAASLSAYVGSYTSTFSGTETAVVLWEDGLAMLPMPTTEPMTALTKLRKTGEHTFRRVRKDDALGETIVFEMGPDGKALRYIVHSNPYNRR
jgi:hypothetical protein